MASVVFVYVMLCAIWHHLYNLKNVENTHSGVLLSVKLQMVANRPKHLILETFSALSSSHHGTLLQN